MKRITLALLLCVSLTALADDAARFNERYNDLGVKVQCTCGCGQELIKCNHVGCPNSDAMIRQLRAALNNFSNDDDVLNFFRRNYGTTAVIIPGTHGFELTIWVVPPVLVVLSFFLVSFLIRRWRQRMVPVGIINLDPRLEELKLRARRETEL